MYAPSFFTGNLISRFGAGRVAAVGLLLTGLSAIVGLGGIDVAHFWGSLILLGVGWNFGFLGASALVLECHRPEEKTRVQSLNDFIVFGLMAAGSFRPAGCLAFMDGIRYCGCPLFRWCLQLSRWRWPGEKGRCALGSGRESVARKAEPR